jgi:multimeric flavodoxin WrbA/Zn-finger nucleic acid-binding protein
MKILGIVGSHRKLGNTDCLVREALLGAKDAGAKIETIRLTDLNIRPCKGCMSCVFNMTECKIEDDMIGLLDLMQSMDGIILGAPTYVLGPQAQVKMVMDRALMLPRRIGEWGVKKGSTIGTAGHPDWVQFMLSCLNFFMFTFNIDLIDSMMAYGPGPGQSLLDDKVVSNANRLGRNLVRAVEGKLDEKKRLPLKEDACPVCHADLLKVAGAGIECPLCRAKGDLEQVDGRLRVRWDPDAMINNRFTPEGRAEHLNDWVLTTEDMYKSKKKEIAQLRSRYKEI